VDLSAFDEDNAYWKSRRKRVPWNDRVELIKQHFPSVAANDASQLLKHEDVLGRVLRDILKVEQIEPGKSGPRPPLDYRKGMHGWRQLTGQDYSERPFPEAFRVLSRGQSIRGIARRINYSKSRVERLLRGAEAPTIEDLRVIAELYNKRPAYFIEYRLEMILCAVGARLAENHEMTVALYRRLVDN
jgi:hypothetical protein